MKSHSIQRVLGALGGALSLASLTACQHLEDRAGTALIAQFGNACVTKGQWTDAAIQQNRGLQDTLEELKKQDPCKKFETQLSTIQGLSSSLQGFLGDGKYKAYLQHQARLSDLTPLTHRLMPSGLSDDAKATLLQSVFQEQVQLSSLKSEYDSAKEDLNANLFKEATAKYVENIQGMMTDLPSLQQCLQQSPRAAIQLATQLMAVGGNSASPAMGASLSTAGQLFAFALSFEGDSARVDRAAFQSQKALMPQGLTCAMEAMTELYCQAEDVREQLEFQAGSYRRDIVAASATGGAGDGLIVEPIWRGMDILTRRLPVIAEMLRKVRNGSDPGDGHDSNRQNEVWDDVLKLDSVYRSINGHLNIQERLYNAAAAEVNAGQIRETNIITTIRELAEQLERRGGPFSKLTDDSRRFACMFAADPMGKRCPEIRPADNLDNYIRNNFSGTTFTRLRANWRQIYSRAREAVDLQLAQQITVDPKVVVVGTMEPSVDNVSPYEALKMVNGFLSELKSLRESDRGSDWNPRLQEIIDDTQARITTVLDAIQLKKRPDAPEVAAEDIDRVVISLMYDKFQLRIGVQFLTERIKKFVEWDLNRRLRRGEFPGNSATILAQLGGEMAERMGDRAFNLDQVKLDLDRSQSLTQRNLQNFLEYFRGNYRIDPIADAADSLLEAANQAGEPLHGPRRPNRQLLAELCILSMTSYAGQNIPRMASDVPMAGASTPGEAIAACRGAVLESAYSSRDAGQKSEVAGLPLQLEYNGLFDLFSGRDRDWSRIGARIGLASATKAQGPAPGVYAEIFRHTIEGSRDVDNLKFNRKVCTFHRFLRAGRIAEALPTLNPAFRRALFGN